MDEALRQTWVTDDAGVLMPSRQRQRSGPIVAYSGKGERPARFPCRWVADASQMSAVVLRSDPVLCLCFGWVSADFHARRLTSWHASLTQGCACFRPRRALKLKAVSIIGQYHKLYIDVM